MKKTIILKGIFYWKIIFIIGDSKTYQKICVKNNFITSSNDNVDGRTLNILDEQLSYIYVENKKNISILIHEMLHVAIVILSYYEIDYKHPHEEILCYLLDYIYRLYQKSK